MIEYILISYVVMLARFIYIVIIKGFSTPPSNVNHNLGVCIGFVFVVGPAPLTFIFFMVKSIFKEPTPN